MGEKSIIGQLSLFSSIIDIEEGKLFKAEKLSRISEDSRTSFKFHGALRFGKSFLNLFCIFLSSNAKKIKEINVY